MSQAAAQPRTLARGLQHQGVPAGVAHHIASLPPVSSLFASVLRVNPVQHLLASAGLLSSLPAARQHVLTGREFFPSLISGPFEHGLSIVFGVSAALSAVAAIASLLRGRRTAPTESRTPPAVSGEQAAVRE